MRGIILYGPPASGKDTITLALSSADSMYRLFRRLKSGPGKSSTYRMVNADHNEELRLQGDIALANARYGATYAIDTLGLRTALREGVPVIHVGQVDAIPALKSAVPEAAWLVVQLRCDRALAAERLIRRNPSDIEARLEAWDETPALVGADLTVDTGQTEPGLAAQLILAALSPDPV